jgi:predicted nucleic acid-binding Zn ribbon protein
MFTGYASEGLAGLFEEEEASREKRQHSYESRKRDRERAAAEPHMILCAVCGEEAWTTSNTARTCGGECSRIWRASQERRRVIAQRHAAKKLKQGRDQ